MKEVKTFQIPWQSHREKWEDRRRNPGNHRLSGKSLVIAKNTNLKARLFYDSYDIILSKPLTFMDAGCSTGGTTCWRKKGHERIEVQIRTTTEMEAGERVCMHLEGSEENRPETGKSCRMDEPNSSRRKQV
ncbi:uncharacterized [Tachysurus ichikawai]